MVSEGKGRLFRRKDDKYLLYLPKALCEDSMFPFATETSVRVKVSFRQGVQELLVQPNVRGETLHEEKDEEEDED